LRGDRAKYDALYVRAEWKSGSYKIRVMKSRREMACKLEDGWGNVQAQGGGRTQPEYRRYNKSPVRIRKTLDIPVTPVTTISPLVSGVLSCFQPAIDVDEAHRRVIVPSFQP